MTYLPSGTGMCIFYAPYNAMLEWNIDESTSYTGVLRKVVMNLPSSWI
jgi:hypothetical protein